MRLVLAVLALLLAPAAPALAIAGGEATRPGDHPAVVTVATGDDKLCGGTLVAPTWVLTAAHCVTIGAGAAGPAPALGLVVVAGRHDRSTTEGEELEAVRTVVHPDGASAGLNLRYPDLALVELPRPPETATPVQVAGPSERDLWAPDVQATAVGWGVTGEGDGPTERPQDVQRAVRIPVHADADCEAAFRGFALEVGGEPVITTSRYDTRRMTCAGGDGAGVCQADSGGPLLVPGADPGVVRVAGVASEGTSCPPQAPGIFARVADPAISAWIARTAPGSVAP